jgi:wobble nucleotide-excising tRNase
MWICGWGMWQPWEIKLAIMLMGLFLCITSSLLFQPILKNEDLFKSIEELEKEKENYHRAVQRLEKKIREL